MTARIATRPVPEGVLEDVADPLLRRIYAGRGVRASDELRNDLSGLLGPEGLPHVNRAAQRIADAVRQGERIMIVGDFDADGATSVALCISVLEAFGAEHVDFIVPNRFDFGYGLSPEIVELAWQDRPDVLVTVDNGVSSVAGVAKANAHGVDVIVTDHHLPGADLPAAYAIVNPNLPGSRFGSPYMAGVGVAYYVMSRVRAELRGRGWFGAQRPEPNLAAYLDLVALGTVADVVPLDLNNRILVQQGLLRMRAGRCAPGIKALVEVSGRTLGELHASDLGFAVGPRLNAAGRLDDMTIGIRCLLATQPDEARKLAVALNELNLSRRALEQEMTTDA